MEVGSSSVVLAGYLFAASVHADEFEYCTAKDERRKQRETRASHYSRDNEQLKSCIIRRISLKTFLYRFYVFFLLTQFL